MHEIKFVRDASKHHHGMIGVIDPFPLRSFPSEKDGSAWVFKLMFDMELFCAKKWWTRQPWYYCIVRMLGYTLTVLPVLEEGLHFQSSFPRPNIPANRMFWIRIKDSQRYCCMPIIIWVLSNLKEKECSLWNHLWRCSLHIRINGAPKNMQGHV